MRVLKTCDQLHESRCNLTLWTELTWDIFEYKPGAESVSSSLKSVVFYHSDDSGIAGRCFWSNFSCSFRFHLLLEPILSSQAWNDLKSKYHSLDLKILFAMVWKHLSVGNLTFRVCIYKLIYLSLFINVRAICICVYFSFLIWFTVINAFPLSLKERSPIIPIIGDNVPRTSIHLTFSVFLSHMVQI